MSEADREQDRLLNRLHFRRETFNALTFQGAMLVVGMATGILVARALGPDLRGGWAVALVIVSFSAVVGNLGTESALVYLVGQERYKLNDLLVSALTFSLVSGLLVCLALIGLSAVAPGIFKSVPSAAFIWLLCSVLPQMLSTQVRHLHLGLKRYFWFNTLTLLEQVMLLILFSVIAIRGGLDLSGTIMAFSLASMASTGVHLISLKGVVTGPVGSVRRPIVVDSLKLGVRYFLTGMGGFWQQRLNLIVLEVFRGGGPVGVFAVAQSLPNIFAKLPSTVAMVLFPWVASEKDSVESGHLATTMLLQTLVVLVVLGAPLIIFAGPVIGLLFGADYVSGADAMRILIGATIAGGLSSVQYNFLAGLGYPGVGVWMSVGSITVLATSALLLVPPFGLEGAAASALAGSATGLAVSSVAFVRLIRTGRIWGGPTDGSEADGAADEGSKIQEPKTGMSGR
jgi:O-antigen/teichoic acid export membrane protein